MNISKISRTFVLTSLIALTPLHIKSGIPKFFTDQNTDTFIRSIPPEGTNDKKILLNAPNPKVTIQGVENNAKFVIDISTNILYKYDSNGNADMAYLIASGRPSMKTEKGTRIVSHVEKYPYRGAPRRSKRRRQPRAFGPYAIIVNKLDTKTGE